MRKQCIRNKKKPSVKGLDRSITWNEFLKIRFSNNRDELQNSTFVTKIDDLGNNQSCESGEIMKGSVSFRKKENRYEGRFYFQGKRKSVYAHSETACWAEIRKKRKELSEQLKEIDTVSKNMYLNTWFDYWVNTFKVQEVKESTYIQYKELWKRYTKDTIGKERISNINSSKLQAFINSVSSYEAKKKLIQTLRDLFDLLQKENYISKNPMAMVVLPKKNKDDKPIVQEKKDKVISYPDEVKLLKKLKEKATCHDVVKFILYTGLRRGEAIGLTWRYVDLKNETITVFQAWSKDSNKITSPKSKAAYRTIPLLSKAKEILVELNNIPHSQDEFVFSGIKRITQMLVYYSEKLNIEVNPHMLRHTFASRCYASGVDPLKIRDLLGHESMDTTLNTYTHVLDSKDSEVIEYMRDSFIKLGVIVPRN